MTDRWQYLLVLVFCLAITAPLEMFGSGVYRHPRRLVKAVLPIAVVFLIWDELAVAGHVWFYSSDYISGLSIPFGVPIEEVLFFLVVPVCGLLTYNAVSTILGRRTRR